ncbi:hypothetical protein K469DRAFT_655535 [Zopfia rhizophila CBS 207.26]|uniref:RRM domain-containing protein n=1 Tax=Zopfia rhizophila CBS 207.26 TaxID=1314779 RepID=A0A6A6EIU7_9PEZI|nr:hypothetical protein K469DRAFT_655535 [Zopfia rhizophila CBS 207.26]
MADNQNFADFVKEARERKRKETLAQEILGSRSRKTNTSGAGAIANTRNDSQKPSLASRMGITKQRSSSAKPDINGKWKHDLHALNNPRANQLHRTASASQVERNTRVADKFRSNALNAAQNNSANGSGGFNIRGVAAGGPYTVVASNFAPGTTAADIEAVMTPVGGEILRCRLISSQPTVMVEMVLESKDGADNVIATFNNKKADGRLLYVYLKDAPNSFGKALTRPAPVRSSYDDMDMDNNIQDGRLGSGGPTGSLQDGRYGFSEKTNNIPSGPRRGRARGGQGLYSDGFAPRRERY